MDKAGLLRPTTPPAVALSLLARELGLDRHGLDMAVTGIALHTASVQPGDLFVALQGAWRHGIDHWDEARDHGAIALVTDQAGALALGSLDVPLLVAQDPRPLLGSLATRIYGTQSADTPPVFAVTGTNGKTSTVFLLEAMMRALGWKTALSTTAERRVNGVGYPSTLTTPEAPDIHAMLACSSEAGVKGVAIEVSAQALTKRRLDGVRARVAGFTNLSHDHFEDFGTMDNYLHAKAALFAEAMADEAVVCIDGAWGQAMAEMMSIPCTTIAHSDQPGADWSYEVTDKNDTATTWLMRSATGESCELLAPIIGNHMVANATLAAVMLMRGGVSATELEAVVGLGTRGVPVVIPGRVERVSSPGGPQVFVDAGRSADAYHHTLSTIRELTPGRLVMVCGTSGNRDHTKRPIMGRTAATLADVVIVTDDDPRNEDPRVIREGLLEGARAVAHAIVHDIPDPTEAISFAISLVGVGDSVLWSGPGSQAYRDIAGKKIPYSARDEARRALDAAGWTKKSEEL